MAMNPRLLRPLATGGFDADAQAYITAVQAADGQALEQGVKVAYNDFITGCKSDGIWDAIKASCILAGARTLAGALVPLRGTAPTNNNFTASDYNRETGLVGDGSTTYLDTNRAANADPQDNFHGSVYGTTITTGTGASLKILMGATGNSTKAIGLFHYASQFFFNNRRAAAANSSVSQALANGFVGASRSSSASSDGRAGGATTTFAHASTTPGSEEIAVFANNNQGSVQTFSDARLAFYSIGESLDLEALDTRVSRLIASVKFALNTGLSPVGYETETITYINAGYDAGGSLA